MSGADTPFRRFDPTRVPSPCHVIDLARLEDNLRRLRELADAAELRVLLALKAFSCFAVADLVGRYLDGAAASGLWEARLARTRFSGEVHTYAPGLKPGDLDQVLALSDHLILNSLNQWNRFGDAISAARPAGVGLRLNPRHSEVATPLYDPCAAWSRLGVPPGTVTADDLAPFDGLHVHALCDQGYEPFDRLLAATEQRFGDLFAHVDWINLGGGQLFTAADYDADRLVERLRDLRARTGLDVYLEPGTAVALGAGALVTEVLDTGANDGHFAIVDASATCHMPDVIEAPYVPDLLGGEIVAQPGADEARDQCVVRLGGPTCLAGDVIGTYRLAAPPQPGDRLLLLDQAYYTMVKATTFNGTPMPAIALWDPRADTLEVVREFGYEAFESRLS